MVTTLPFTDAGNTSTYGNNYSSSNIPPFASNAITNGTSTSYISGDEVVYEYTPVNNEIITISLTGVATVSFPPFLVPNNPGTYRLRVQYVYNQLGENLIPCSVANTYAETEDYMVNVLPPPTCIPPNTLIATNLLATSATVSWT